MQSISCKQLKEKLCFNLFSTENGVIQIASDWICSSFITSRTYNITSEPVFVVCYPVF